MTLKLHCQFNSIDLTQRTYRKEIPLKLWKFPGNEVGVKFEVPAKCNDDFLIEAFMPTSDEIQQLFQIVDILRNSKKHPRIALNIPYLPYARQDRVCNPGESFALKLFIQQLDSLSLQEINVVDLHSQVSRECLSDMHISAPIWSEITQVELINHGFEIFNDWSNFDGLLFPDSGAKAKFEAQKFEGCVPDKLKYNINYMTKTRSESGVVYTDEPKYRDQIKNILVVDDICDGGRTFLALHNAVTVNNPDVKLSLFVTHGIFSHKEQFRELTERFEKVYTYKYYGNDPEVISGITTF